MTALKSPGPERPRMPFPAVLRGLAGRCPNCGRGHLLSAYITPIPVCSVCNEDLSPYLTADFASYLVMFLVGLFATPAVLVLSMKSGDSTWPIIGVAVVAIGAMLFLLPRAKGAGIGLLWALDVKANQ